MKELLKKFPVDEILDELSIRDIISYAAENFSDEMLTELDKDDVLYSAVQRNDAEDIFEKISHMLEDDYILDQMCIVDSDVAIEEYKRKEKEERELRPKQYWKKALCDHFEVAYTVPNSRVVGMLMDLLLE